MVIRYCIRSSLKSKKNASTLKNKLIKITPEDTIIDIVYDDKGKQSANAFFAYALNILHQEFDFLVVLDDSVNVNINIHSNLLNSKDIKATRVGLIHLSMPSSATLFSKDTKYDPEENVFFRTEVVYDSRGLVFSKKLLTTMDLPKIMKRNIFSLSHFVTKSLKNYKMNNTIFYPSLIATIKENIFLDEYDYEILDDVFSLNWNILLRDAEFARFLLIGRNYKLHEKMEFMDDFGLTTNNQESESNASQKQNPPENSTLSTNKTKDRVYFLDMGSTYTWSVFVQCLSNITKIEIVRSLETAEGLMAQGYSIFTNGFHLRFIEVAKKYPAQLNCFWHSSFSGVDIMQERELFISFLDSITKNEVRGFFLNPYETLIPKAKRFWLPFSINSRLEANNNTTCDFAIVASSPYSVACKNVLATIIYLLNNNYSFVIPKWLASDYKVEVLKSLYSSESTVIEFETHDIPIEPDYYRMARFYLMTSHTDTMPYSCIESINNGTPFIITSSIGWASYFQDEDFVLDSINSLSRVFNKYNENDKIRESLYNKQKDKLTNISNTNKRMIQKMLKNYN
jgi:hypothetical protein